MKKLMLSLFAAVACFSCDSDTDTPAILLIKSIRNVPFSFSSPYKNFTYEGNKIVQIDYHTQEHTSFAYEGDLIVNAIEHHVNYGTSHNFIYDDVDRLVQWERTTNGEFGGPTTTIVSYTYNADETVSFSWVTDGDLFATGMIYLENDQVWKIETNYVGDEPAQTATFTYDTKEFYGKHILNYKNIAMTGIIGVHGIHNNILTATYTNGSTTQSYTYDYTYNADDYPTAVGTTYTNSDGSTTLPGQEFTYEQP